MKSFMRKKGDGSLESVLKKIEDAQVTMDFWAKRDCCQYFKYARSVKHMGPIHNSSVIINTIAGGSGLYRFESLRWA